ncbi:hypothetical protein KVT40_007933 [Elsinoe batatas]|uniref:Uncharacterized protein n=1 Tax=Elsinoe batatas TaxID=2601811 RepID=A0A8K0KTM4_9PEZI|nr:hypothetical protein KVT40_007933 [Elsinoe batatas]
MQKKKPESLGNAPPKTGRQVCCLGKATGLFAPNQNSQRLPAKGCTVCKSCSSVGAMQCRAILRQPVKERHPITRHHNVAETFCRATKKFRDHSMQTVALQETTWHATAYLLCFPKMICTASEICFASTRCMPAMSASWCSAQD